MDRAILLRYHEIALKGTNRGWFEERLAINARKLLERALTKRVETHREHGRVIIKAEWNSATKEALGHVFGITSFSPMRAVPTEKNTITQEVLQEFRTYLETNPMPRTFRVFTRRSDKALPETSIELDREVGAAIKAAYPLLEVDLTSPQFVLGIEIRFDKSFLWTEKIPGLGGLPVGTSGHLLTLLSGGLDSPVAAIQALKRGAFTSFIHFYGTPFVGPEVLEKIEDLAGIINRFQPDEKPVYIVPFGKIQEQIALSSNPKMRTILYRRMMIRISCALAQRVGAQALVTGESLGQVASQTLENISTIDHATTIPILRPLITFDKDEIIELAHRFGTFDTATRPGLDCCTLFADRHPIIRSSLSLIEEQEIRFPIRELEEEALSAVQTHLP